VIKVSTERQIKGETERQRERERERENKIKKETAVAKEL